MWLQHGPDHQDGRDGARESGACGGRARRGASLTPCRLLCPQDVPFPDGDAPPDAVISKWLGICKATFAKGNAGGRTIAVHCVAGLGRAPVLVAIALIEHGMEPLQAVQVRAAPRRGVGGGLHCRPSYPPPRPASAAAGHPLAAPGGHQPAAAQLPGARLRAARRSRGLRRLCRHVTRARGGGRRRGVRDVVGLVGPPLRHAHSRPCVRTKARGWGACDTTLRALASSRGTGVVLVVPL